MINTHRSICVVSILFLVAFVVASCTKAVVAPIGAIDRPQPGKTYVVYLKDGREIGTKDLRMEIDDSLTFSSLGKHYHVQLDEVDHVERIETDTGRTVIAVTVVAAIFVTAFYFLTEAIVDSVPAD
jgi:hypothetical protein